MTKLITFTRPSKKTPEGVFFVAVLGRPSVGIGDEVSLEISRKTIDGLYVSYLHKSQLKDVTFEDLYILSPAYHDKKDFWTALERGFGGALPGNYEVAFLGLSEDKETVVPSVFELELEVVEEEELEEDIAEDYEEDYEDEITLEKFNKKKDWS